MDITSAIDLYRQVCQLVIDKYIEVANMYATNPVLLIMMGILTFVVLFNVVRGRIIIRR